MHQNKATIIQKNDDVSFSFRERVIAPRADAHATPTEFVLHRSHCAPFLSVFEIVLPKRELRIPDFRVLRCFLSLATLRGSIYIRGFLAGKKFVSRQSTMRRHLDFPSLFATNRISLSDVPSYGAGMHVYSFMKK